MQENTQLLAISRSSVNRFAVQTNCWCFGLSTLLTCGTASHLPIVTAQGIRVHNKDNFERLITEEYLAKRTLFTWQLYLGWQYDVIRTFPYEKIHQLPVLQRTLWAVRRQKDAENSLRIDLVGKGHRECWKRDIYRTCHWTLLTLTLQNATLMQEHEWCRYKRLRGAHRFPSEI